MPCNLYFPINENLCEGWFVAHGYTDEARIVTGAELYEGSHVVASGTVLDMYQAWAVLFELPSGFVHADKLTIYYQNTTQPYDPRHVDFPVDIGCGEKLTAAPSSMIIYPGKNNITIKKKHFAPYGVVDPATATLVTRQLYIPAANTTRLPHNVIRIGERFILQFKQLDAHVGQTAILQVQVQGQAQPTVRTGLTIVN
jgi:hypothetical protein